LERTASYLKDGVIRRKDVEAFNLAPPMQRIKEKRPVAMIECIQEIPCNSCVIACKLGAIQMENVNALPKVDYNKCTGCMACAMVCPGQAVFLLRAADGSGQVTLPYEFLPTPKAGEMVKAFDREGKPLGIVKVVRVLPPERNDGTSLVTIEVPEEWIFDARGILAGET
jgi:Fe-S-cluster-containing hydrogenase component 2